MKRALLLNLLLALAIPTSANAAILKIEVTGNLDWGTDYTNEFGLGANHSMVGSQATMTWLIDSTRLGPDAHTGDPNYDVYSCGGQLCTSAKSFMSASVSINGITKTLDYQWPYTFQQLEMLSDWDGAGLFGADQFLLRVGHTRSAGDWLLDASNNWYQAQTGLNSSIAIVAQDKTDSLLNGMDVNQLHGWSTNSLTGVNDSGSIVVNLIETDKSFQTLHNFQAGMFLTGASIGWWTPATNPADDTPPASNNGTTTPSSVPEPASLALIGLGFGLLRWSTRRKL